MNNSKLLNFFFFLVLSLHINSSELNQSEYDCMLSFLTNMGQISNVRKNETTNQYQFCNPLMVSLPIQISCSQGSIIFLNIVQSNMSYQIKDELSCFFNINNIYLSNVNYEKELFFKSFPKNLKRASLSGTNLQFSQISKDLQYLSISVDLQTIPTLLKFSWLLKTFQFIILPQGFLRNHSHLISFENDLGETDIWLTNYLNIISLNLPPFRNVKGFAQIELIPGYNQSTWSNIKELGELMSIAIKSTDITIFPNEDLPKLRSNTIKRINFEVPFNFINKMCDLSSIGESIEILTFTKGGRDFSLNGLMPILLPNNQRFKEFVFNDGYIEKFNILQYENAQKIILNNNSMAGLLILPPMMNINKLIYIDISNNQITGELDDSYCQFDIIVTNNLLTGLIPTCFTCFFGLTEVKLENRFKGNNFINIDQPSSITIISPNLIFSNIETLEGQQLYKYYIFGENLGGSWITESDVGIIGLDVIINVEKPNKLISILSLSQLPSIVTFSYSKINSNYRFVLSPDLIAPKLLKVYWIHDSQDLSFDGSYFSYNLSIINITIGNVGCQVTSSTFYKINCTLLAPIDLTFNQIISYIIIGNLTTQFTLNPGVISNILSCNNDCNGNGICLSDIGKCKCDSTHQGDDCSLPVIECNPSDCNGGGVCITLTGKCQCDPNHQGDSCQFSLKECLNGCNNNIGTCNNQTGICSCPITPYGWSGIDCSIPLHTISAVLPSNTSGGDTSIYGWFGNVHTDPQVFIGNNECTPIYNISESEIICNAPAGTGLKSVSVIQNSINVTSKDIYQYYSKDKQCPNHCTSTLNGICNTTTGYCTCIGKWSGYDCSLYSNPSGNNGGLPGSNTTIDGNTGNTNITNQQTNYQILITKLIEIDFNGKQVNEYSLLNNWSIFSNISKTVYTFIQSIQNNQCNITYTIEEINNDRDVTFAGISFKLTSGSVKMTVAVENYQYLSNLNTIQLQMKSSVNEIETNDENHCNDDQIEINNKSNQNSNSLNYISIKKDAKVLNGRFIDRIESDGISTYMQTVLVSKSNDSITVGMNLPHCTKKCLLDPDFSVLVSSEFVDKFSISNSQTLNENEYDCLKTLLTNLGSINKVKINTTSLEYLFCGTLEYVSPFVEIYCDEGSISKLVLGQANKTYIVTEDFSCFKNMTELEINDIVYDRNKFYNSYPPKATKFSFDGSDLVYGTIPPIIKSFESVVSQKTPTTIKFSWYLNTNKINFFSLVPYKGYYLISFENDLDGSKTWDTSITINSLNVPSLKYITGDITLTLMLDYDQSSWANISSFGGMRYMTLKASDLSSFPNEFSNLRSETLYSIYIDIPFSPVSSMIDLSLIGKSMESLYFNSPKNFTYGGSFPIILPTNEAFKRLDYVNGNIETFNFSLFTNVEKLILKGNLMSNDFPSNFNRSTHRKLKYLDISNNNITGTINESFCQIELIVANNSMTGLIPNCFTCFFGLPEINLEKQFIGNNFINLNTPSSPSIIIPNIVFSNTTIIEGLPMVFYEYLIFGENLGGSWVPSNAVSDSVGTYLIYEVISPNKLFKLLSLGEPKGPLKLSFSKSNPNYTFTLSLDNTPPQLISVDWQSSTTDLVIDGSFFSYNNSIINIRIGNESCLVTSTTFYQIKCTLSNSNIDSSLEDILSYITIGNLTTQFTLNPGVINTILNCTENYNDCNGNGICLSDIGKCKCDSTHQGDDCSLPVIECNPSDCNGGGVCITLTGKCQCDSTHQGDSCQFPLKECLNDCNNNIGTCNNQTGICSCPITPYGWSGIDCSIPLHTISAVLPSNTSGGDTSIYGWFGNVHTDPQVFIGNNECTPIYNISESEIICNAPAGTGLKSVSVIQNSINVTSKDIYQYYSKDKQCPNHCTSTLNGICNTTTGYCTCIGKWSGYDCSLYSSPSGGSSDNNGGLPRSNTTIDDNTGNTIINNQQTNYQILITKLIEIDFNGKQVNEYSLLNNWSIFSNISKTVYTFIQSIQNNQCNITYTIEEVNNDRDVTFAGISFKLTSGSVKMTVAVENYQYLSNLNTIQLQMKSSVNEIETNDENHCNDDQIEINNKSNQNSNSLNYISIKKDAKVLNGRFIDRIESDGISTYMQTVLVSKSNDSITVGMNLPHCTKKCLLDPDFSVLISTEFVSECDDNKRESWFLPVVIAIPVGGAAAIVTIGYLIYKKRFIEMPLKNKLKSLGSRK
ncbi:hypothetical protein ACTFIV_001726 [Dictyostelium citrinum]